MVIDQKNILAEEGWKDVAPDCKGKDKELLRTLLNYWALDEDGDFDLRCKTLGKVAALAGSLKGANEVKADADAVKYLTVMIGATKTKQAEIMKAKAEAQKASAIAQKKSEAEAEHEKAHQEDDEEDDQSDSFTKLKKLLLTARTAKVPYHCLVCDAKPYGLVVSKKDISKSSQHRKELVQVSGGSTRPPKYGQLSFDGSKLVVEMEKPPSGLARILQKWIKENLGLGLKVMVGAESGDDDAGAEAKTPESKGEESGESPEAAKAAETGARDAATEVTKETEEASETPENATRPLALSGSVGRGGKNKPDDVSAVQAALNLRAKAGLEVDGKCGSKTIAAIIAFQKSLNFSNPDGRVDPGKTTEQALNGQKVTAPKSGAGGAIGAIGAAMGPAIEAAKKAAKQITDQQAQRDNSVGETINRIKQAIEKKIGPGDEARKIKDELEKAYKENQGHAGKIEQLLKDLAKRKTDEVAEAVKKAAEKAMPVVQTVEQTVRKAVEWLQQNAPGIKEDPNDLVKRVTREIAEQKKKAEQAYNEAAQKVKKVVAEQAGPEGKAIKDELEKAYNETKDHIKKVEEAAKNLVNRKTDEAIKALVETAKKTEPVFKAIEDQAGKALDWAQKQVSSVVDGAKDVAKKVTKEVADQKKSAEKAYNDVINKLKKAADDELGEEGRKIKDELEKAYKENQEHAKQVAAAAAELAKRKSQEALEALNKAAEVAVPGYKTVEDLSQKALDWWNS